ncbi:glycosyltransferase family 2 protein [Erythrobacter sp. R86502]|uniref:glycosyltransferase family 2 protein n=1 Tax=Erythrobacter sp. R86502 TaxID=3093846 RepID=UPI0036D23718
MNLPRPLLRALVHLEALASGPKSYLEGVAWRIRGLKVRSRHRFSALMGHTHHAYDLWMASREVQRVRAIPAAGGVPPIVIVIDCRNGAYGLARTLRSIADNRAEAVDVAILGPATSENCITLPDQQALARWISARASACWLVAVECGDLIAGHAIRAYRAALKAKPDALVFYADDDLWQERRRQSPHFKPQWNAELALHHDFVSYSSMFLCNAAMAAADWPRGAMDWVSQQPVHVPHVLHHRVSRPQPVRPSAQLPQATLPHVSVIIPTRNHAALLRKCMAGVRATAYPSFDITVIDNGSGDSDTLDYLEQLEREGVAVDRQPGPFNYARMHNNIVPHLAGPLICFLNNDIEMIGPDWLSFLAAAAMRDDVGAAGARLLYPDRSIQHAGVVIGVGGGAGHAHRLQCDGTEGYFGRAHLPQYVSAVTAACLVMRKDRFEAVGGFNAEDFAVAFNDVDLCLKLNARGWQSFYEPRACLIHHESKSRGFDRDGPGKARFDGELAALKRIWKTDRLHDRFHHPELSQFGEQFVVRL